MVKKQYQLGEMVLCYLISEKKDVSVRRPLHETLYDWYHCNDIVFRCS